MGDLGDFTKGAPLSKADISDDGTPFILYGELYTTYGEIIRSVTRRTNAEADNKYKSRNGDVIIPTSGETPEEIATASCVMPGGVILGGDLNIFRGQKVDGRFLAYLIRHKASHRIARIAQGVSIVHVSSFELRRVVISIPSPHEQEKIVAFLDLLDARIAAQRRLVALLKKHRRGLLLSLFPSDDDKMNLRFKGCAQGWRWETVSNTFQTINDKAFQIKTSEYRKEGRFDVVDQGKKDVVGHSDVEARVFKALPIIVFGDHTTTVKYRDRPFIVGGDGVKLLDCQRKDCDLQYLFYALLRYGPKAEGYKRHFGILKEKKIPILPLNEQLEITGVLSLLSSRISSAKCAIVHLESLKRGFLQQLFA